MTVILCFLPNFGFLTELGSVEDPGHEGDRGVVLPQIRGDHETLVPGRGVETLLQEGVRRRPVDQVQVGG